jgi:hypothetical protein
MTPDVYRAANDLIDQFGEDALTWAAKRHNKLLKAGDVKGSAIWKRVIKATDELLSKERPEGAQLH